MFKEVELKIYINMLELLNMKSKDRDVSIDINNVYSRSYIICVLRSSTTNRVAMI